MRPKLALATDPRHRALHRGRRHRHRLAHRMQPTEFDAYVRNEIAANETLVKAAGLAAK
jgi:tripartite-type tricarboxylate transporter receptor subunit TctC